MTEALTFKNYRLGMNGPEGVYRIGIDSEHSIGVAQEIAAAYDYELARTPSVEDLGGLIRRVAPEKELQKNIAIAKEALATQGDPVSVARSWVERSGLLLAVERSYYDDEHTDERFDFSVITGGVRNWMNRRATRLVQLDAANGVGQVLLVAGNRPMQESEGPDVKAGMTEADYMEQVVAERLADLGISRSLIKVDSPIGDDVMETAARKAQSLGALERDKRIAVVSNAGAWVQNSGQFRRAATKVNPIFDLDIAQLYAVSDTFPLGTDKEPATTHQNPFSAIGVIVRNLQELSRAEADG